MSMVVPGIHEKLHNDKNKRLKILFSLQLINHFF